MINIHLCLSNPWKRDCFNNLFCYGGKVSKNKAWEVELYQHNYEILKFHFGLTFNRDHAGINLNIALFTFGIELSLYDTRHWNYETNTWKIYDNT
jgi:hypothetical protein